MIVEDKPRKKNWVQALEPDFKAEGPGGEEFFYLLDTMLDEGRIPFLRFLEDATNGFGCTVHQGLYYSLDQDWEYPELFNGVAFFVGYHESGSLSVKDYLSLLAKAVNSYIAEVPENEKIALEMLGLISNRLLSLDRKLQGRAPDPSSM
jgi:hypothetical protein